MTAGRAIDGPGPAPGRDGAADAGAGDWCAVAQRVADRLAADAVARERAGGLPAAEIGLLRDAGLLPLLVPADRGGAGQPWAVAHRIVRIVGAADASVGHLLGYHYLQLWRLGLYGVPEAQARAEEATARRRWFWAGIANPRDAELDLRPDGRAFRVSGRKSFATGARLADRLVVSATRTDTGDKVTFLLDGAAPGIRHLDDWDNLGQRLTASGGVVLADVPVAPDDVVWVQPADAAEDAGRASLAQLGFQLVLTQLYVAIAEGALAAGAAHTRRHGRPWPLGGAPRATDDPYVLAGYGRLAARTAAAAALADRAAAALDGAATRGEPLTAGERGEAALAISAAKVVATEVTNDVTSAVFELTGARSTAAAVGLDRFWRNARTLTLHDPVAYKAAEVGAHLLTGALPPVTGYS